MIKIPLTKPYLDEAEQKAAARAIASGWVSQGPRVAEFESVVAKYVGTRYAVATASCTAALHTALLCFNIGPGDEVIVPSFTFIASANSILYTGATPVFVDIDPRTYNIDASKIEEAITVKTKAIMPIHQIGLSADMDPILNIARKHKLHTIEDAAPTLGEEYKGRRIGSISALTCFSFHPRKIITTGEGGMLTTDNKELAEMAQLIRSHGASVSAFNRHQASKVIFEKYDHLGYNYRMTDIQAALGIEQMKKLEEIIERRRRLGQRYNEKLAGLTYIETPYVPPYARHTYQSYIIRIKGGCPVSRNEIMQQMLERGIATRRGVMAIHLEPYYRKRSGQISLPITEEATQSTMLLPIFTTMSDEEQDFVVSSLREIVGE